MKMLREVLKILNTQRGSLKKIVGLGGGGGALNICIFGISAYLEIVDVLV